MLITFSRRTAICQSVTEFWLTGAASLRGLSHRFINTFKYHDSCTDGKISVRINLLFYLYFPPSSHPTSVCFFPVGPSQETEVTSTPTRPVENVVLTTKGLQERNIQMLDGTTVENIGKVINQFSQIYNFLNLITRCYMWKK